MDSSSESTESDYAKKKEKIEKFKYPDPPKRKISNEKFTARIPLVTNLLEVITKEKIHIIVSIINIELLKKEKEKDSKNKENNDIINITSLTEDIKKKIRNDLFLKFKNIKKIIFHQKYILAVINGQNNFPNNINIIHEKNEYLVKFDDIKEYKYNNIYKAGNFVSNILEIIFRNILLKNETMVKLGQNYMMDFIKKNEKNTYKGFYVSTQITSNGLYMMINSKDKIIGKSVYTKITDIQKKYNEKSEQKEKISEYFQNHKNIIAIYGEHKVFKIAKINFDKTPNNTNINIKSENGLTSTINLKDYYNKYYKIEIKDKNQYLIEVEQKVKKPKNNNIKNNNKNKKDEDQIQILYLIPELFRILGPDDYEKTFTSKPNFITPNQKIYRIKDIYHYMNSNKNKLYKTKNKKIKLKSPKELNEEWGINLGKFIEFKARIIDQPKLFFSNFSIETNQGRFRTYDSITKMDVTKQNCFYLYFENAKENKDIFNLNQLKDFDTISLKNNLNWDSIEKELRSKEIKDKKEIGIVLLTENTKNKYPKLKKYFINNYPKLVTQFVKIENFKFKNSLKK